MCSPMDSYLAELFLRSMRQWVYHENHPKYGINSFQLLELEEFAETKYPIETSMNKTRCVLGQHA